MKKVLALVCVGMVAALFTGCGITNPVSAPTITVSDIGAINAGAYKDVTGKVTADTAISAITYTIVTSADASVPLTEISVTGPTPNGKTLEFTSTSPIRITATNTAQPGSYKLKISVTAGASGEGSFPFTISGTVVTRDIDTATLIAGSNQAVAGSSIDLDQPAIYTSSTSIANVSKIDLCYAYTPGVSGISAGDYLFSPDQAEASGYSFTSGWTTTPNSTAFYKTTLTEAQFDAITTKAAVTALWSQPAAATPYIMCAAGDVFIAKTDLNAIVLIHINSQTAGNTGSITLKIAK